MKKTWLLLFFVFVLGACTAPSGSMAGVESSQPVTQPAADVSGQVEVDPGFWAGAGANGLNTGYCPPGDLKVESGQWYFCTNAFGTTEWRLTDDSYFGTPEELASRMGAGEQFSFFPLLGIALIDPIPGDELIVLAMGGLLIIAVSNTQAQNINYDLSAPPIQFNSYPEFEAWTQTQVSTVQVVDQVGAQVLDSPVDLEDINYRRFPNGTQFVIIEDNPMWLGLEKATVEKLGGTVIGMYPNCNAWRIARATGLPVIAHVYIVDEHAGDGNPFGHTCVAEIASLTPPPVVIAGFSAEDLDEVTDRWSPGQESSVRELMEEGGADFVVRKSDQFIDLLRLVTEILGKLG